MPTPTSWTSAGKSVTAASDGSRVVYLVTGDTGSQMFRRVGTSWKRSDTGPAFPTKSRAAAELRDVGATSSRVVAVGNDGRNKPLVVVSANGATWRRSPFADSAARLLAVASDRGTLAIAGWRLIRGRAHLAIWTSRTGAKWRRVGGTALDPVGAFVDATPGSGGLLAAAFEGSGRGLRTSVWGRSHGAWRGLAALGPGVARGICAGSGGVFVVASSGVGRSRVLVWRRPPGGRWSAEPDLLASEGFATRCADGPKGVVVVGNDGNGAAVSWSQAQHGPDGRSQSSA